MLISVLETIIGMVLTHTHYAGSNKLCTAYYVILSALHRAHICSVHVFMRAHNIQRLVYINIRTHAHIQTVMEFPIACGLIVSLCTLFSSTNAFFLMTMPEQCVYFLLQAVLN